MAKPTHQSPSSNPLNKTLTGVFVFIITICFCSLFYILGSYTNSNSISQTPLQANNKNSNCPQFNLTTTTTTFTTTSSSSSSLLSFDFEPHHRISLPTNPLINLQFFKFCDKNFTDYCPCHDLSREIQFDEKKKFYRERHCPKKDEVIRCLVPKPIGYRTPFKWPESRKFVWFHNVPYKRLVEYKKSQNWVRLEGERFVFPGGGTSFRMGVKDYVNVINKVVPLKSGNVRTVLDVGCGVASFGAALMDYNILTMSIAPRDIHEAQVQFALERGLPAMLGILSVHRLPFPARSFDMVHCSRCLVPWTDDGGLYLMEVDRVLRPGGYWVLSGPPVGWKTKDMEKEQGTLDELAMRLCWKKVAEEDPIAVWKKPTNHVHCIQKLRTWKSNRFCDANDADTDAGWYKRMDPCITLLPDVKNIRDISGGALEKWPKRLNVVPPRLKYGVGKDRNVKEFYQDNQLWTHRVSHYGKILKSLPKGIHRNIMDMNAGLGSFAAALSKYPVWVMNVIPSHANNTLGVIYERGLMGTYTDWCEAFSTYPRTYDLIHANGIFSMYMGKCDILNIFIEMHRILRPKGAVIVRDHVDIIVKAKIITDRMRWNGKVQHSEHGPHHPEKILLVDNSEG